MHPGPTLTVCFPLSGAKEFALKVTYWKDSELAARTVLGAPNGVHFSAYSIFCSLVHLHHPAVITACPSLSETPYHAASGGPLYPVVYFLTHAMAIAAVRSAAVLLGEEDLLKVADRMVQVRCALTAPV